MDIVTKRTLAVTAVVEAVVVTLVTAAQFRAAQRVATELRLREMTFKQAVGGEVVGSWLFVNEPVIAVVATTVLMLLPSLVIAKAFIGGFDRLRERGTASR